MLACSVPCRDCTQDQHQESQAWPGGPGQNGADGDLAACAAVVLAKRARCRGEKPFRGIWERIWNRLCWSQVLVPMLPAASFSYVNDYAPLRPTSSGSKAALKMLVGCRLYYGPPRASRPWCCDCLVSVFLVFKQGYPQVWLDSS